MKTVTMLSALHTAELSNVRRAANKRRYAITKSEDHMKIDVTKAVLETPAEGEETLVATMKSAGASDARVQAAVASYRIQKGFADVLKPEDIAAVAKSAGFMKDMEDDEEDEKAKKAKKTAKSADEVMAGLDPETRELVQATFKANADLSAKASSLEKTVEGLKGMVGTLVNKSAEMEYVAKAEKEFSHIPGSPQEIALVLKSAHDASPELAKGLEKLLGQVNAIVGKSAAFASLGSTGAAGSQPGSAWARIEQLAGSLTMKSEKGSEMSKEAKVAHVIAKTAEGKALYREYLAENPSQRAKHNF